MGRYQEIAEVTGQHEQDADKERGHQVRRFRRTTGLALAITLLALTPLTPAMAGERNTGVWQVVAIGLGAGLLLSAISHPPVAYSYRPVPPPVVYYEPAPPLVIYPYPPVRAVVVPTLRYYSVYGVPHGRAHGYWKHGNKGHHGHHDDD